MEKQYMKPAMQVYDIRPTQILCGSGDADPYDYPLPFGYAPGHPEGDETLMA